MLPDDFSFRVRIGYTNREELLQSNLGACLRGCLVTDRFQIAAEQAASSYTTGDWFSRTATERSEAIYRELRKLDIEAIDEARPARAKADTG
jgi:hypothetical protein